VLAVFGSIAMQPPGFAGQVSFRVAKCVRTVVSTSTSLGERVGVAGSASASAGVAQIAIARKVSEIEERRSNRHPQT